jgi:hypothetical protein
MKWSYSDCNLQRSACSEKRKVPWMYLPSSVLTDKLLGLLLNVSVPWNTQDNYSVHRVAV